MYQRTTAIKAATTYGIQSFTPSSHLNQGIRHTIFSDVLSKECQITGLLPLPWGGYSTVAYHETRNFPRYLV